MASSIRANLLVEMISDTAGATSQNLLLTRPIRVFSASNIARINAGGGTVQVFHVNALGVAVNLTEPMVAAAINVRTSALNIIYAQQDFVAGETIRATQADSGSNTVSTAVYVEFIPLPVTGNS